MWSFSLFLLWDIPPKCLILPYFGVKDADIHEQAERNGFMVSKNENKEWVKVGNIDKLF